MVNLEICLPPVLDERFFGGKVGISVLTTFSKVRQERGMSKVP